MIKRDPSRFLLIGFLGLFFLCVLLGGYWIVENLVYTQTVLQELEALAAEGAVRAPEALAEIGDSSEGRANRYLWEGAFFLLVLIGGMIVLIRTLQHDRELRRRQQNFLAAVSHEFKSPLASMQLAAETLILRSTDPDGKRLGQRVLEDCERLLRMVDNLLDTTRIEEGRHELRAQSTNLAAAAASAAESFKNLATRHGIDITQKIPDTLSVSIDPTALDTILRNLIDNAFKACIAGQGNRIEVSADQEGGALRLMVRDDGLGFPSEDAELMFEKFHRLGDELTRKTPGTGLGLYIVRRLAEQSGASVKADSHGPGRGATMTLVWPKAAAA